MVVARTAAECIIISFAAKPEITIIPAVNVMQKYTSLVHKAQQLVNVVQLEAHILGTIDNNSLPTGIYYHKF
jgi:hypothetical protein